jgi:hypothetical protein
MTKNIVELQKTTALKIKEIQNFTDEKIVKWDQETQTAEMADGTEWLVLTDEEADEETAEEIKEMLWAFRPNFIIEHMEQEEILSMTLKTRLAKSIEQMQINLYEDAKPIIYALVGGEDGIDNFISDAIDEDGRGHFLAYYDGEEKKTENFFVYRLN